MEGFPSKYKNLGQYSERLYSIKPFKKIAVSVLWKSLQKSNFFFVFIFGEEAIPPQKRRHAAAVFFFGCEKLLHFKLLLLLMLLCMPCLCLYKKHSISSKSHGQKPNKKPNWVEAEREKGVAASIRIYHLPFAPSLKP